MASVSAIFYLPEKLKKNSENIKKVHAAALEFKEKSKAFTVDIQNINELVRNDCVPPYLMHMTFPCLLIGRFSGGQIRIEENYTGVKKILKWIDEQYGDDEPDEPDEHDDERDDKGNKIPPAPAPTREADDDGGDGFGVVGDFDKNEDDDDIEDIHEGEFASLKKESKFQQGERERQREQRERQQEMVMKRRGPVRQQRQRRLPKSDDDFEDEVEKVPDEDDTISSSSSSKTGKKIGTGKISAEELTAQQEKIEKDRKDSLEKLRKEFEMSDKQKKNRGRFELQ